MDIDRRAILVGFETGRNCSCGQNVETGVYGSAGCIRIGAVSGEDSVLHLSQEGPSSASSARADGQVWDGDHHDLRDSGCGHFEPVIMAQIGATGVDEQAGVPFG